MSEGRRGQPKRYLRKRDRAECVLCGGKGAFRSGVSCPECIAWLKQYDNGSENNCGKLTIRQIHALRKRVEQELPLFEGGKLCV